MVIDTRENDRLFKKPPKGLLITRDKLESGDYSIRGFEHQIAIERKSLSDLYLSLGVERERFKKELERLQGYERKWLVVEGTEYESQCWQEFSDMNPVAVRASLVSIEVRLGIPVYYQPKRSELEDWILSRFVKFFQIKREGN